jgi:hypothetical protein
VVPTKPFSLAREETLKQSPDTNIFGSNNGVDHVGHHHQLDLPPVLQEISGRCAEATGT